MRAWIHRAVLLRVLASVALIGPLPFCELAAMPEDCSETVLAECHRRGESDGECMIETCSVCGFCHGGP